MTNKWTDIGVVQQLAETLTAEGLLEPTPVQCETIGLLLAGSDVTARSQTGSGKTLAFLLPALQLINSESSSVQAIVIAPTQELAMQITRVAQTYSAPLGIRVVSLIGGAAVQRQIDNLKKNKPQLIIGTPGRIHELYAARRLKLSEVKLVVIDEADQVFNLGSVREVDTLLKSTQRDRQLAFFSATRPEEMAGMENKWMREPKLIDLAGKQRVAETIEHYYIVVDKRDKVDAARRLVRQLNPASALLFLNDTDNIAQWESKLRYEGFSVDMLYGDANKQRRSSTLDRFRGGDCKLLLATDIAARGIDIMGLPLVLNLDPPIDADHYVHRAGRTGRMGKPGIVITIITHQERFIMDKFSKRLGIKLAERVMSHGKLVSPEEFRRQGGQFGSRSAGRDREPNRTQQAEERPSARQEGARTAAVSSAESFRRPSSERPAIRKPADTDRPRFGSDKPAAVSSEAQPRVRTNANKPQGAQERPQSAKKSKAQAERQRQKDKKDKGAPKWLKEKRNAAKEQD
ncbi:superfamily II DNA/RNA helicase [Paenibacillus cellulosilyticus]|uniref:Superfamily II DNA/RNA helicase n=1 Tax=Paenibacillus cellulosilyticus TaxID=375489 RepID=A0A2V2YYR1_9BACL|nr:DEAD/DEAH box helicase [Paenibacillus cellulosilyticus]PWW07388.1 superfamily II DNA/RNA helicase [Paenibacillus cellulosilyticus]QKS44446.1 DEAD/DEAH box helicase [Paenibacillus cellulosilyticus]